MEQSNSGAGLQKEILRVALDKGATAAYGSMIERIRAWNSCVRIQPSQFVSFLVRHFEATHFEGELQVLVSEFFDSEKFVAEATAQARGKPNFEDLAGQAVEEARRIKGLKGIKAARRGQKKLGSSQDE